MNEYNIKLIKIDGDGDEYVLAKTSVSADDAITYLIEIQEKQKTDIAPVEEVVETAPIVKKSKVTKASKFPTKTCCGSNGPRHKKDCKNNPTNNGERYKAPTENPWYYTDILDLLKDGESDDEIYRQMSQKITNSQFREALEWAKSEII